MLGAKEVLNECNYYSEKIQCLSSLPETGEYVLPHYFKGTWSSGHFLKRLLFVTSSLNEIKPKALRTAYGIE